MIRLFVGFDQREAIAYHVFCQSVMTHASKPISFIPLITKALENYQELHVDGSNDFIYTRFLCPKLSGYQGYALFVDGDMICRSDISNLWALRDPEKAVQVVKHDYQTKFNAKYLGNKNENYPRKNWSSVMLWNCGHPANRVLTDELVMSASGKYLHRFEWLTDDLIGELPIEWNWLDKEYDHNPNAFLYHYTIGTPCFREYRDSAAAAEWFQVLDSLNQGLEND